MPEPSNHLDQFAVCVKLGETVVGHLKRVAVANLQKLAVKKKLIIPEMLKALFTDTILFEFTDFVRHKQSFRSKGVRNWFDLSNYSTHPEFDLSGVFSIYKAYQNQEKIRK